MTSTQSSPQTHSTKGQETTVDVQQGQNEDFFFFKKNMLFLHSCNSPPRQMNKAKLFQYCTFTTLASLTTGSRHMGFQHFQVSGHRNSLPVHTHPVLSRPCGLTAEQWPVPSVAVIEKRDCSPAVGRPSVSLSGLVSVALVGGEGRGLWRARQPPVGSC